MGRQVGETLDRYSQFIDETLQTDLHAAYEARNALYDTISE